MKLPNEFELDLLFPDEYSDFIAEICYRGQFICLISQEKGYDHLQIEFDGEYLKSKITLPLDEFIDAIAFAKKRLWELRKSEE